MGSPTSLLRDVRGFARDYPRDRMPDGLFWDLSDYVPVLLDAQLTGRGGWVYASNALPGGAQIDGGIHAAFRDGTKMIVVSDAGRFFNVDLSTGAATDVGLSYRIAQNPVMFANDVIAPNREGQTLQGVTWTSGGGFAQKSYAAAPKAKYATVYKSRLVTANAPGLEERINFSAVLDPTTWDANSFRDSSVPLTGIAALRSVILLFHEGSVERVRGSIPPEGTDPGDMNVENLFDRAGCGDAKSIAYWSDNCIFADERGCHLTDGAIVRNLISQGGMIAFWRALYRNRISLAAETYLDYYLISVIRSDGIAVTLICDLNRRAWFRFTNFKPRAFIHSYGIQENLWGARDGTGRLTSIAECFFPTLAGNVVDGDGTVVLPSFETPWYRLGEEGRKRVRFAYTSYDIRVPPGLTSTAWRAQEGLDPAEQANAEAKAAIAQMLEVGYITSPQDLVYTVAGHLPSTDRYRRFRLPLGRDPYGLALRVRQLAPSTVTRVFDVALEARPQERSRV